MSYKNYIKSQVKHHRCVICAKTFGAHYDDVINTFPIYHTSSVNKNVINCENVFFNEIVRIYRFLHDTGESMSMRKVIEDFAWSSSVSMKKEMIEWCIGQGYFRIDSLHRLHVPPIVLDECSELFCNLSSGDPAQRENATELVRAALRCFSKDLEKPPVCDSSNETSQNKNIDTDNVVLRSDEVGMVTSKSTGADEIGKRIHHECASLKRKRFDCTH